MIAQARVEIGEAAEVQVQVRGDVRGEQRAAHHAQQGRVVELASRSGMDGGDAGLLGREAGTQQGEAARTEREAERAALEMPDSCRLVIIVRAGRCCSPRKHAER